MARSWRESCQFQEWEAPATQTLSAGPIFSPHLGPDLLQVASFLNRTGCQQCQVHIPLVSPPLTLNFFKFIVICSFIFACAGSSLL